MHTPRNNEHVRMFNIRFSIFERWAVHAQRSPTNVVRPTRLRVLAIAQPARPCIIGASGGCCTLRCRPIFSRSQCVSYNLGTQDKSGSSGAGTRVIPMRVDSEKEVQDKIEEIEHAIVKIDTLDLVELTGQRWSTCESRHGGSYADSRTSLLASYGFHTAF